MATLTFLYNKEIVPSIATICFNVVESMILNY